MRMIHFQEIEKNFSGGVNIHKNLIQANNVQKIATEKLLKNLEKLPDIDECEYIYVDDIDIPNFQNKFLRNKILITQNSLKEYLMFETNDIQHNGQINNMTKLQYKQRVDLVILNNFNKTPNMDSLIDKDTIITKNLGDNIFYIEDLRNDLYIIITEKERLVIEGRGAKTQLKYHETKTS